MLVKIRNGTPLDGETVRKIAFPLMQAFGLCPDPEGLDIDLGRFGEGLSNVYAELVACSDARVVGSLVLQRRNPMTLRLMGFYVEPEFQGRGIGRRLLDEAVCRAEQGGFEEIYLETWGAMAAAVHLYESYGWKRGPDVPAETGSERSYSLNLRNRRNH